MNKAKRGELKRPIPIGYIYDDERVIKDPDMEIQNAVEMVFEAFRRVGSAHGVVMYFKSKGYKFPYKIGKGIRKGEVSWVDFGLSHAWSILHNPYYAGVYFYGRSQKIWTPEGKKSKMLPRKDWHVFIKDHHATYISFEEFESNERIISENYTRSINPEMRTPPREGPALIQGLVWCGKCGQRMSVSYYHRDDQLVPNYRCQNAVMHEGGDFCQSISGQTVDKKISELLIAKLTPEVIAQTVEVQKELDHRQDETLNYYRMRVEKCKYEADRARGRYYSVDFKNRLVALELETTLNTKIDDLNAAIQEYESQAEKTELARRKRDFALVDNLAANFSEMFNSDAVSYKDKKRMVRYLIEDVTLSRSERGICVDIRFKGHTTQTIFVEAPLRCYENWTTDPEVIKAIDKAAENHTMEEIAALLNQQGFRSGKGLSFTRGIVKDLMYSYSIPNMKDRYLNRGYVLCSSKAATLGITAHRLTYLIRSGKFQGEYIRINAPNEYLFPPEQNCEV